MCDHDDGLFAERLDPPWPNTHKIYAFFQFPSTPLLTLPILVYPQFLPIGVVGPSVMNHGVRSYLPAFKKIITDNHDTYKDIL